MFQFKATFTRYSNKTGRREISSPHFFYAESWGRAVHYMHLMVTGMNSAAEPGMDYKEASLEQDGLSGHRHNAGLWTTLGDEGDVGDVGE